MDYNVDVYFEGKYYYVTADLYDVGTYSEHEDDSGRGWYEITNEPEFYKIVVYDYDTDEQVIVVGVEFFETIINVLQEVYWAGVF